MIIAATVTLPWTAAVDLEVSKPANAMGQFFTETFRRRTGKPLAIVIGDVRTAGLVAFASPDRPSLYIDGLPARAPWLDDEAVREKGAIVIWTATDTGGHAAASAEGALPRHGAGSTALVRPLGAGPAAIAAHRLGDDPAAVGSGRALHPTLRGVGKRSRRITSPADLPQKGQASTGYAGGSRPRGSVITLALLQLAAEQVVDEPV